MFVARIFFILVSSISKENSKNGNLTSENSKTKKKILVQNTLSWRRVSIFVVFLPNLRNKNPPRLETPTWFPAFHSVVVASENVLRSGFGLAGCLSTRFLLCEFWLIGNTLTRSHAVAIKHTHSLVLWLWLTCGWLTGWLVGWW